MKQPSSLKGNEIDKNSKNTSLFSDITAGLQEAIAYEKGELKAKTTMLFMGTNKKDRQSD